MASLNLIPPRFTFLVFFFGFCSYYSPVSAQGPCIWVVLPGSTTGSTVAALTGVTNPSACQAYCITNSASCYGVSFDSNANYCYLNQLVSNTVTFNSPTTTTYYGLIKGSGVTSCSSATICTWNGQKDMHSFGATQISSVTNVNDCINYCNSTSGCVAAEWNYNSSQCWVYNLTLPYPAQTQVGIYFFQNPPNCQVNNAVSPPVTGATLPTATIYTGSNIQSSVTSIATYIPTTMINLQQGIYPVNGIYTVNLSPNKHILNGNLNSATSLLGCLTACSASYVCMSIDWNNNTAMGQQCFLNNSTQSGLQLLNGTNNYALTSGTAAFAWNLNPYINTNILGGFLSTATNLPMCQFVCQTTPGCQGIDWANSNSLGQQCFLLFTQSNRVNATNVNHYDLFFSGFCIWSQSNSTSGKPSSSSLLQLYQYNCYTLPGCSGLDCTTSFCNYSYNGPIISGYNHYSFQCIGSNQVQSTNNVPYVTPQSTYPMAIKPAYIVLAGIGGGCILMVIVAVCVLCQYHLHDGNYVVQGQNGGTSTSNVHTHRPVTIVEDIKMEEDVEVGTVEENPYFNDRNSVTKEENEF